MPKHKNKTSFKKGQSPWNKGLVGFRKGYKQTSETKKKISDTRKMLGLKPAPYRRNPNKLKKCLLCEKEFEVIFSRKETAKFCSRDCRSKNQIGKSAPNKGKTFSEEWKKNLSESHIGKFTGKEASNWQGGKTPKNVKIRNSLKYKLWRKAVFERDSYTCIWCGDKKGGNLEADHIKPFAYFPKLRFELSNGRTLCKDCHRKTDTYLGKSRWKGN